MHRSLGWRRLNWIMARARKPPNLFRWFDSAPKVIHFNQARHLVSRQVFKDNRFAALAEWQSLMA